MATTVTYNGITLNNIVTRAFQQEVVYDASHTDRLYSKCTITVEGICHNQDAGGAINLKSQFISPAGDPPSSYRINTLWQRVSDSLQAIGGDFLMSMDGVDAIGNPTQDVILQVNSCQSPSNFADCDNGPKPKNVNIIEIVSNKIIKVQFTIDLARNYCSSGKNTSTPFVFSNRWSINENMDVNAFITRTIEGRLRMAWAANQDGTTIPAFLNKYLCVPPLEPGFRRENIEYVVSENLLECQYRVVDRQVKTAAPYPATKMDIEHSESTVEGVTMVSEVSVRLYGPPHISSTVLMSRAEQILNMRFGFDTNRQNGYLVDNIIFTNFIGEETRVEARARIHNIGSDNQGIQSQMQILLDRCSNEKLKGNENPKDDIPDYTDENGATWVYHHDESFVPELFGYDPGGGKRLPSNLFLLSCYLQTPCSPIKGICQKQAPLPSSTNKNNSEMTKVQGYQYPEPLPVYNSPNQYSDETKKSIYTLCDYESTYSNNGLMVQLPLAVGPNAAETDETTKIIQLGGTQARREIVLHFERVGEMPQIPQPIKRYRDGSIRGVLLRNWERFFPPVLSADGSSKIFRVDAHYLYALNRPPTATEKINVGVLPYTNFTSDQTTVDRKTLYSDKLAIGKDVPPGETP